MTVERLCPKSAKSTRYFHAERISHWLIASFLVIDMMILQVEDYFQEEEEEEYDFWADYADYSDEDGQTNQVCLLTSSPLSSMSSSFIALKLFLHSDKKGQQWDKPGTVRKKSAKHRGNEAGSL